MNAATSEDADVPELAVKGLNDATRKAKQVGEIVVIRSNQLLKIVHGVTVEVVRTVPGRRKVGVLTKKLKK